MNPPAHHPFLSVEAKAKYLSFNEQQAKAWPVPFEERTVETAQGHTFMRVSGPADGSPLVLLPGGGTNSMWTPNIAGLSERHRTYALDSILDVGRSANTRPITTVDELTQWLDDVLEALGLRAHVRLMGLSHGAWTAAQYARRFPARLVPASTFAAPSTSRLLGLAPHPSTVAEAHVGCEPSPAPRPSPRRTSSAGSRPLLALLQASEVDLAAAAKWISARPPPKCGDCGTW